MRGLHCKHHCGTGPKHSFLLSKELFDEPSTQ